MTALLVRPTAPAPARRGLLLPEHFQVAYVTRDLDRACGVFGDRYGIGGWSFIEGRMAAGGDIRVAFAWAGGTMIEIIDARGPGTAFYNDDLAADGHAIRFHHFGYLLRDRAEWEAMKSECEAHGLPIAFESLNPGFMDAFYVHAPELGHYLEYILPEQPGLDFFAAVPVS